MPKNKAVNFSKEEISKQISNRIGFSQNYIEDLTDNRTLPKTFLSIQWDNEGFEYDQLSDEDFDKLPSVVVIDEKSRIPEDYLSVQYQCLCVYVEEIDDED